MIQFLKIQLRPISSTIEHPSDSGSLRGRCVKIINAMAKMVGSTPACGRQSPKQTPPIRLAAEPPTSVAVASHSDPRKELLYPRLSPEQFTIILGWLEQEIEFLETREKYEQWTFFQQNRLDDLRAIRGEVEGWLKGDQ